MDEDLLLENQKLIIGEVLLLDVSNIFTATVQTVKGALSDSSCLLL